MFGGGALKAVVVVGGIYNRLEDLRKPFSPSASPIHITKSEIDSVAKPCVFNE